MFRWYCHACILTGMERNSLCIPLRTNEAFGRILYLACRGFYQTIHYLLWTFLNTNTPTTWMAGRPYYFYIICWAPFEEELPTGCVCLTGCIWWNWTQSSSFLVPCLAFHVHLPGWQEAILEDTLGNGRDNDEAREGHKHGHRAEGEILLASRLVEEWVVYGGRHPDVRLSSCRHTKHVFGDSYSLCLWSFVAAL